MNTLFAPLRELEEFDQLNTSMKKGEFPVQLVGCMDTQKSHMIAGAGADCRFRLIITHNEVRAKELVEDLKLYEGRSGAAEGGEISETMYYPAKDFIFYSADVHGQAIVKERLKVIKRLMEKKPTTIVTTIDGGMDYCLPFSMYKDHSMEVKIGDVLELETFRSGLVYIGYENVSQVGKQGGGV